jgi:phenylacetate-coenzyme A ligase PaaK-like adenylate-forming protein
MNNIEKLRRELDAHVREIIQWHFSPETGSPFWLDYASQLDFDPRKEINEFDDLKYFGHFEDEWLRGAGVRQWIPKGLANQPRYVFETGGTTGIPKLRVHINDLKIDYELLSNSLSDEGFPPGSDWLMLGPTGPRRLRLGVEHVAQHRGGMAFFVDLDPRWVKHLTKYQKHEELKAYLDHVINQALRILRTQDTIRCLYTTPKLLEALCEKISLNQVGIKGIYCSGTEISAQFHRFVREELAPGIDFVPVYGNSLMGLALSKPFDPADNYTITYYSPFPRSVIELVNPNNFNETVGYGQTGRVLLTTLTKEFFMPRFPERDEGERAEPCDRYPWDGVKNLRVYSKLQQSAVVGVY